MPLGCTADEKMNDRKASGWRTWTAAGIFVGLVVAGVLISRTEPKPEPTPTPAATPSPAPIVPAIVPRPLLPLTRSDLIDAADRAASHFAGGEQAPASDLPGRRFTLSLPFGCAGPAANLKEVPTGWSYDAEDGTLRVKVTPQVWTDAPILKTAAAGVGFEAAEGFWIDRPWKRSDTCPPQPGATPAQPETPQAAAPVPSRQTLGLVELFEPGAKREERRNGRAYEAVKKVEQGELALDKGLRLVVEGRLVALANGQAIGCWSPSPDQRPVCMIRVRFDRIAITGPTGEQILAEWKS